MDLLSQVPLEKEFLGHALRATAKKHVVLPNDQAAKDVKPVGLNADILNPRESH
jgi:hypothetical protein